MVNNTKFETVYLVDTENMGNDWMNLINLNKNILVCLCYTDNNPSLPIAAVCELFKAKKNQIKFHKCICGGKNALDFQLSAILGEYIGQSIASSYVILAKDKGYDALTGYYQERNINVSRVGDYNDIEFPDKVVPIKKALSRKELARFYFKDFLAKNGVQNFDLSKYNLLSRNEYCRLVNAIGKIYPKIKFSGQFHKCEVYIKSNIRAKKVTENKSLVCL